MNFSFIQMIVIKSFNNSELIFKIFIDQTINNALHNGLDILKIPSNMNLKPLSKKFDYEIDVNNSEEIVIYLSHSFDNRSELRRRFDIYFGKKETFKKIEF